MKLAFAMLLALGACEATIVDLGREPGHDASTTKDASTCTCRITMCRVAGDCSLIGGACGPDFYCVGDFGSCSTATQCQATVTSSACTVSATSTTPCP